MFWRNLHKGLLAGVLVTGAASPARADHDGSHSAAAGHRTVCVKEWVPEQYETTRTTYKTEWKEEKYTAYRTECVPEKRTITVCVPAVEEREVVESHVVCRPVERVVRKCVDRGHWECREVECKPHLLQRLLGHFHRNDCCDPCDPCCAKPVRTKTEKVWVSKKVWEETKVTVMERVCEKRKVKRKVCVTRHEKREVTVNVSRCVPYEAVRKVAVCVPTVEKVTCTRMVCRTVAKQVPCEPCCETTCAKPRHRLFGFLHGHRRDCCD